MFSILLMTYVLFNGQIQPVITETKLVDVDKHLTIEACKVEAAKQSTVGKPGVEYVKSQWVVAVCVPTR